jgi:SAM-dependent methyltransferase
MREPFLRQSIDLIHRGAAVQDVHDSPIPTGFAVTHVTDSEAFIQREINRVAVHARKLVPVLEHFVGPVDSILDVGCSTGGSTVALALSEGLGAKEIVGIDPNKLSLQAARLRACGHDLNPEKVRFEENSPGKPLPFCDGRFDLTVCVSVIEFVGTHQARAFLTSEISRVTAPGGFVYIATPNPFRLRECHSGRFLGNFRRRDGYPWSSLPRTVRSMFPDCKSISISAYLSSELLRRLHFPIIKTLSLAAPIINWSLPWQRFLFQKTGPSSITRQDLG